MIPRLDRSENLRLDATQLAKAVRDPRACFVLYHDDHALLRSDALEPVAVVREDLPLEPSAFDAAVFLGFDGSVGWFALDLQDCGSLEALEAGDLGDILATGVFTRLGGIDCPVPPEIWALLAHGRALLAWNQATGYCPVCGSAAASKEGGHQRVCTSPDCGRIHFPRTDMAVIVRVIHGDRCLLARQASFRPGVRSMIAGFVEPGESLEGAVRREVVEEVGLKLCEIRYLGSQPWPFPMSMMIAFEAQAISDGIAIDEREIESAEWYTRERALEEINAGCLVLSSPKAISRRMVDGWLAGEREI